MVIVYGKQQLFITIIFFSSMEESQVWNEPFKEWISLFAKERDRDRQKKK